MTLHILKIDKEPLELKIQNKKHFEIRKNDRNYQIGDVLCEREYDRKTKTYSDRCVLEKVIDIMSKKVYGIKRGYCVLITLPLYSGSYKAIKDFVSFGNLCFDMVDYLAKSLEFEDYCIWENIPRYQWFSIYYQMRQNQVKNDLKIYVSPFSKWDSPYIEEMRKLHTLCSCSTDPSVKTVFYPFKQELTNLPVVYSNYPLRKV